MKLNLDEEYEKRRKAKKYESLKKWRENHPEKYKKIQKKAKFKYALFHKEQYKKSSADYYRRHREEILRKKREKYQENKKKLEEQKNAMERDYGEN